jgi:hypothetical protein
MKYVLNVLVAIDQLGNALGGGNPDNTVSARVGFFAKRAQLGRFCWQCLEKIIDFAFYPLDGPKHCQKAVLKDPDEDYLAGKTLPYIILGLLILLTTPIIGVILHLIVLLFPKLGWAAKQKEISTDTDSQ